MDPSGLDSIDPNFCEASMSSCGGDNGGPLGGPGSFVRKTWNDAMMRYLQQVYDTSPIVGPDGNIYHIRATQVCSGVALPGASQNCTTISSSTEIGQSAPALNPFSFALAFTPGQRFNQWQPKGGGGRYPPNQGPSAPENPLSPTKPAPDPEPIWLKLRRFMLDPDRFLIFRDFDPALLLPVLIRPCDLTPDPKGCKGMA